LAVLLFTTAVALVLLIIQPDEEPVMCSLAPLPALVSRSLRANLHAVEVLAGHLQPSRLRYASTTGQGRQFG
jgi:hypothetical protein